MYDGTGRSVTASLRSELTPPRERGTVQVSVLVPARDEADNLPLFMEQMEAVVQREPVRYEVVVIDDGSTDGTWRVLQQLMTRFAFLRAVRHRSGRGIAEALRTGWHQARGEILVFYPADLQFKPEDIPTLVGPILAGESDMVTGFKQGKYEKAFVSKIYNGLSRTLFNVPVRDLNNVKAYRREIMEGQPVRPDWHRYMIVIAHDQGYTVSEVPIPLYPRNAGRSKFGISRIPIGVLDMLSVWFELRFGRKPLLAFGMAGAGLFAVGVIAGLIALGVLAFNGVGLRWVWTLVQTLVVVGSVFFATGILGEQIAVQRAEVRELRQLVDEQRRGQGSPSGAP